MSPQHTTASQPANQVTLTILHQVEALGTPRGLKLTHETREQLSEELRIGTIKTMGFPQDGLNDALFRLLGFGGPPADDACALALQALTEEGFAPSGPPSAVDVLHAMDAVWASPWHTDAHRARVAYGAAVALTAGRPDVALTLLDGPEGAGVGWDEIRDGLLISLGEEPESMMGPMVVRQIPS
jgi:hypothetical protein